MLSSHPGWRQEKRCRPEFFVSEIPPIDGRGWPNMYDPIPEVQTKVIGLNLTL